MASITLSDETGEPLQPLWSAPTILAPKPDQTVPPGFLISGITGYNASTWRVQFFRGGNMIAERRKSATGEYVSLDAPSNLIPPGEKFHFRLDYSMGVAWSAWAYSGDLTMDMSLQPPLINEPKENSYYGAGTITIKGTCKSGAAVSVYDFYYKKLGDAAVQGTSWAYTHIFNRGMQFIRAGQKVGSEESRAGDLVTFTVVEAPPAPTMIQPLEGGRYTQFAVPISGTCLRRAKVEVLDNNGTSLGFAQVRDVPDQNFSEWWFEYSWKVGTWQIRAQQISSNSTSPPTELRTFLVR